MSELIIDCAEQLANKFETIAKQEGKLDAKTYMLLYT